MANNIFWGKIYEFTNWGKGIVNNISWGKIYADLVGALPSFALDFLNISNDFTFTRSSFATRVNEQGLIETVTDLGSELVQNGDFEELSSELVTNGDFSNGSTNWNLGASWSIENNKATNNGLSNSFLTQNGIVENSKSYLVSFDIADMSQGALQLRFGDGSIVSESFTTNGTKTSYYVSSGTDMNFYSVNGFDGSIDNVSVKQVDPNDNWSLGDGWSIEDGKAINDGSQTSTSLLQQTSILTLNKLYKVSYDLTVDSGTIYVRLGFSGTGATRTTSGSYTEYVTCSGNTNFDFLANSAYSGSIDNISVQEVLEDDVPRIDYTDATFDVPVLGDELVVNGSFDTDSDWIKQEGWSIANGKATFDINDYVSGNTNIFQNCLVVGKEYVLTYDVVDYVQGYVRNVSRGDTILRNANGTYTEKFISNNVNLFFKANIGENTKLSIDNVSVKEVTAYTTTDKGAFLLEPQSTNLFSYSEDFENQWTANAGITITNNTTDTLSPSGEFNSSKVVSTDNTRGFFRTQANTTSSVTRTIYLKGSVGGETVTFKDGGGFGGQITHTLTTDWERYEFKTSNDGNTYQGLYVDDISVGTIYAWGAQFEELPYATSYIPTNGSIATRSAETCVNATPTINSEEGVLYAEISALADVSGLRLFSLNDGSTSNIIQIYYSNTSNRITTELKVSNSTQFAFNHTLSDVTDINKIAFKYKENDFALWVNGVEVYTDTLGTTFTEGTLSELDFDIGSGSLPFYGRTKDLKIYTEALTDEQLTELTTI